MKLAKSLLRAVLFVALAGAGHTPSAAQPPPQPIKVTVATAQKKLLIHHRGARHPVDLSAIDKAHDLNEAKLLFASAVGSIRYLLVYVRGPSRSPAAADKYCGAGTEGSLVWLMLDSRWRLLRSQTALIESCFESAEGDYEINGARLTARWSNFHLNKSFTMSYDSSQPAAGMSVVERSLDSIK